MRYIDNYDGMQDSTVRSLERGPAHADQIADQKQIAVRLILDVWSKTRRAQTTPGADGGAQIITISQELCRHARSDDDPNRPKFG